MKLALEKAKLMQLEIEERRKLPKNVKDSISKTIFQDLFVAVIIMAYFCIINITYYKLESYKFEEYMKYFALGIILVTVIFFEFAYRKNSLNLGIIGIELLLCGVISLYIPYIFLHTTSALRVSIMILPATLVGYYAIKSIIIFKQNQFQYRSNLSDVKEIVKETEKNSYLDEESTKTYRAKLKEEEAIRKKIIMQQNSKSKQRNIQEKNRNKKGKRSKH